MLAITLSGIALIDKVALAAQLTASLKATGSVNLCSVEGEQILRGIADREDRAGVVDQAILQGAPRAAAMVCLANANGIQPVPGCQRPNVAARVGLALGVTGALVGAVFLGRWSVRSHA